MAFSQKLGKHFHNPAVMRQHERDSEKPKPEAAPGKLEKAAGHGDQGEHGGVVKAEVHHPEGPENPSPGKHHVVLHHADGHEEHSDHETAEEAHSHAQEAAADPDHDGDVHEDMEAETCPECGAKMEGGECPECGYKEGESGEHEEDLGGSGY